MDRAAVEQDRGATEHMHVALSVAVDDATCLPGLRRWIRENVRASADALADAQLVCTELVSNSIEHAIGPRAVRIDVGSDGTLSVEVDDSSPEAPLTPGVSRLGSVRGRGLMLVNAMSRWGVRRRETGKTVWAVVSIA
jgi:two-component sensor histidine kinase